MTAAPRQGRPVGTVRAGPGELWRRFRRHSSPYIFLIPFFLTFLAFVVYPLIYAFNMSLSASQLIGGRRFVGLDNYVKALHDPILWQGIGNVLTYVIVQIPLMLGLALLGALLLDRATIRGGAIHRLVWFLPFAVPSVVATMIWGYLYGQSFGPIAQVARALSLPPPALLTIHGITLAIGNILTWGITGYNMVIMFAALKAIPPEIKEAAQIDGASGVQIARRISIPLIAPAITLAFIFAAVGTLQLFNEPQILNQVAPSAVGRNYSPNLYIYSLAFGSQQFGYSAAIAFSLAMFTGVLALLFIIATRRQRAPR